MDPIANIKEQRVVARELQTLLNPPGYLSEAQRDAVVSLSDRLSELVLALDEWRRKGGFDPYMEKQ